MDGRVKATETIVEKARDYNKHELKNINEDAREKDTLECVKVSLY